MSQVLVVLLTPNASGAWTSPALDIPDAVTISVKGLEGGAKKYTAVKGELRVSGGVKPPLFAEVQIPDGLVTAGTMDQARLRLDAEKLKIEERAGRRTLWFSLASALISAGATIAVAFLTHAGAPPPSPPVSYRDLQACLDSLNQLDTLAELPTQTLENLRVAVDRHQTACQDRLQAALSATP